MVAPRVCVLRAPGTNCDVETAHAFDLAGGQAERVHLFRLLENPEQLRDFQILCIPGGFSYGDDLGAGVIFSEHLRGQLHDMMQEFRSADTLTLGICNGFQVLLKAGLLEEANAARDADRKMTLTWNRNSRYTDCWVRLKVASDNSIFLRDLDEFESPIAHAEGRLAVTDSTVLEDLRSRDAVALCYWPGDGSATATSRDEVARQEVFAEPANPNGSVANVAGLSDSSGRVLGLMPHPERFLTATQHPQWTRSGRRGEGDGMQLFRNAVEYYG